MNQEILKAVKRLIEEHPDQLGDDAKQFNQWLNQTPEDDPEAVRQTANRLIQRLQETHPDAWETVRKEIDLGDNGDNEATRIGFHMPPGPSLGVQAGTPMVCPESGCDYRRPLRQKGQTLFCPKHAAVLVSEAGTS